MASRPGVDILRTAVSARIAFFQKASLRMRPVSFDVRRRYGDQLMARLRSASTSTEPRRLYSTPEASRRLAGGEAQRKPPKSAVSKRFRPGWGGGTP